MSEAPREHILPVRVYYEDTDFSGVVYHATYLRFMERGRTELLREAGVDGRGLFARGLSFAVRRMTLDFARAAQMDDLLDVRTTVESVGGASVAMRQTVERRGVILVQADIRLALVADGRAVRLPPDVAARLGREAGRGPRG